MPPGQAAALAEPLARRALDIDPWLAEAHAALGFVHAYALRWTEAEASFRHAFELEPTLTPLYGDFVQAVLLPWGRLDEALQTMKTAREADPLSLDLQRVLAYVQLSGGRYDEAAANLRAVIAADPAYPFADVLYTWALLFQNQRAEALSRLAQYSVGRIGVRGYIHAIQGHRAEAEAIAAQFDHMPQRQAEIFGLLGDGTRALGALERLAVVNPGRAAAFLDLPFVSMLRGDRRVQEFRDRLRFPR
jgi:tetratricopeptide (TPR) repeat protein